MNRKIAGAAIVGVLALAGCAGDETPAVTAAPSTTEAPEPVATEPEEAEAETAETTETTGTRDAPLAIGESRKIANDSAWTVGIVESNLDAADAILAADEWATPPAEGERFLLGKVSATVDAAAISEQGMDLSSTGADAWVSLFVEYVGSDGKGHDASTGTSCYTQGMLYDQGTVYNDGGVQEGYVCISAPADVVDGGLWRISNSVNDAVWVSGS